MNTRAAVASLMLLAVIAATSAAGGCPDAFIAALNSAQAPQKPPDVESCPTDYSEALAHALVVYKTKKTPDEVRAVVALIRKAHEDAGRRKVYSALASEVKKALPNYEPAQTDDDFGLLDNLAAFQPVKPETTDTSATRDIAPTVVTQTGAAKGTSVATDNKNNTSRKVPVGLLIGIGALLFVAALAAAGVVLVRRKQRARTEERALHNRINDAANKLDASLKLLDENLQKTRIAIDEKLAQTKFVTPEHLTAVMANLAALRQTVEQLVTKVEAIGTPPPAAEAPNPVALEHQVLSECWKQFRANAEASAAFDNAVQEVGKWDALVNDLAKFIPPDLRPMFDAVVGPCKEHRAFLTRIGLIPRVISGDAKVKLSNDADEIKRAREFADLLRVVQSPSDPSNRLSFRFHTWVTDAFLPFADAYLQRYQQARLENGHAALQDGVNLVRRILRVAAVEPIDVVLGETPFDSTLHVGRSMTNDPRFSDGVITGVVRNGFIEGGQQVIRQPEVIVNRMR